MLWRRCARFLTHLGLVAGLALPLAPHGQDWGTMATISSTLGVNANRLCLGEGSRGDIGCPAYAPTMVATGGGLLTVANVSATGGISVTGNVSANRFIGDGSGLTGVVASSGDRITSGTTLMVANGNTNYISITTTGVTTGYFNPAGILTINGVSVSTGHGISATNAYFSGNVGIGTRHPSTTLHVAGNVWAGGTQWTNSLITSAHGAATQWRFSACDASGDANCPAEGAVIHQDSVATRMSFLETGEVGIGTTSPATSLTVVGEVQVSNSGVTCAAATQGAIRYTGGNLQYCNGSSFTTLANAAGVSTDRITSGTTSIITNESANSIFFATAGGQRMLIDSSGGVAIGMDQVPANQNFAVSGSILVSASGRATFNAHSTGDDNNTLASYAANAYSGDGSRDTNVGMLAHGNDRSVSRYGINLAGWAELANLEATSNGMVIGTAGTTDIVFGIGNTERMRLAGSGEIGIGTATPAASLTVVGEVQVSNSGVTCAAATQGAIRYTGGNLQYCNGSSFTTLANAADISIHRITSGTTAVTANQSGYISLTTGGTTTGYLDTAGRLIAPGISTTTGHGISASNVTVSNYLHLKNATSGTPTSADCDHDDEIGRIALDSTNHRIYVCMGATRGWDYATLND